MSASSSFGSGLFQTAFPANPHLVRGNGLSKEVRDVREDVRVAMLGLASIQVEEFTDLPAASANAIKLAIATVAAITTYSGAQLDGAIGGATLPAPRNVTITTAGVTPADAPANAVINGLDVDGNALSETITVAQTATIATGVKAFSKITSIVLPAADGTAATLAFGFGSKIGLRKKIKARAGLTAAIKEIAGGAVVTNGVFVLPATAPPYGTYAPNTVPDGTTDYAIYYEADET